jgi:hypothetical protein
MDLTGSKVKMKNGSCLRSSNVPAIWSWSCSRIANKVSGRYVDFFLKNKAKRHGPIDRSITKWSFWQCRKPSLHAKINQAGEQVKGWCPDTMIKPRVCTAIDHNRVRGHERDEDVYRTMSTNTKKTCVCVCVCVCVCLSQLPFFAARLRVDPGVLSHTLSGFIFLLHCSYAQMNNNVSPFRNKDSILTLPYSNDAKQKYSFTLSTTDIDRVLNQLLFCC